MENNRLKDLAKKLNIEKKVFTGRIQTELPTLLKQSNFYISMPTTEGVSHHYLKRWPATVILFSNIAGNQSWITHRNNGQLITVDDSEMLAEELLWLSRTVHTERNLFE
jgi:hypothetical protein